MLSLALAIPPYIYAIVLLLVSVSRSIDTGFLLILFIFLSILFIFGVIFIVSIPVRLASGSRRRH